MFQNKLWFCLKYGKTQIIKAGIKKETDVFLEHIGNKMLLEKKLNIECGNGYFGQKKEKYADSSFCEAKSLSKYPKNDWLKVDIEKRDEQVYERLKHFLQRNFNSHF